MRILPTPLSPAAVIEIEPHEDARGMFARTHCAEAFAAQGLPAGFVQSSLSFSPRRHTLRGLHYQAAPHAEAKLVRCTRGAAWDVLLDLRPTASTFLRWHAVELTADNRRSVYIPAGFGHGFLTLQDDTELLYQMTEFHEPEAARGLRWNDPAFGIPWPCAAPILSVRDASYPDFAAWPMFAPYLDVGAGRAAPPAAHAAPAGSAYPSPWPPRRSGAAAPPPRVPAAP